MKTLVLVLVIVFLQSRLCHGRALQKMLRDKQENSETGPENISEGTIYAQEDEKVVNPAYPERSGEHNMDSIKTKYWPWFAEHQTDGIEKSIKNAAKKVGDSIKGEPENIHVREETFINESHYIQKSKNGTEKLKEKSSRSHGLHHNTTWLLESVTPWCSKDHVVLDRGIKRVPRFRVAVQCNGKATTCRKSGRPACTATSVYLDVLVLKGYTRGPNRHPIYQHELEKIVRDCICRA